MNEINSNPRVASNVQQPYFRRSFGNKKALIIALIIILLGGLFLFSPLRRLLLSPGSSAVDWYAVHLSNGQVYFGHIKELNPSTIALADTYSLELFDQTGDTQSGQSFKIEAQPQKLYDLVRRGGDTLLTTDHVLFINRQSVLFWEKLDPESDVVRNIKKSGK